MSEVLRVVHGNPTPEEVAAVVVVLASLAARPTPPPAPSTTGWSAYWRTMRAPLLPGSGAWRSSGRAL